MPQHNIRRSVAMSQEMHGLLRQLAVKQGRDITEAHLIREAIRLYLDEQSDLVGSRRHFQKSFQMRMDRLERALSFQMTVLVYLLAGALGDDTLIDDAIVAARRDGAALLQRIADVRDLEADHD